MPPKQRSLFLGMVEEKHPGVNVITQGVTDYLVYIPKSGLRHEYIIPEIFVSRRRSSTYSSWDKALRCRRATLVFWTEP